MDLFMDHFFDARCMVYTRIQIDDRIAVTATVTNATGIAKKPVTATHELSLKGSKFFRGVGM